MFLCLLHITTMPKMYTSYRLLLYIFLFVVMTTLYPSTRSSNCIFINCINKFKTTTRVKTWVKISKVMPQPKSVPPGKGGKPYGKSSKSLIYNMVRLNRTYYSLFKLQAKFSKIVFPSQIPANYANSAQFAHIVCEPREIRTFC